MKKSVRPGVYRLPGNSKGNEYESYRTVTVNGARKKQWRTFESVREAIEWHNSTADLSRGMILRDVWLNFQEFGMGEMEVSTRNKLRSHAVHLEPVMDSAMKEWTPATIDRLIAAWRAPEYLRGQKSTRVSYRNELALVRQLCEWYRTRFDFRFPNPVLPMHKKLCVVRRAEPKPEKDLSTREVGKFLAELGKLTKDTRYESIRVMAEAQYGLYARIQEIAAIHYEDFDPKSGLITLNKKIVWPRFKGQKAFVQAGLKAGDQKRIKSEYVAKLLQEWCVRAGIRSGLVFPHGDDPMPYRAIQFRYDRAFLNAGIPHRGTHIVRHAALTEHYETCGDIYETMHAAGHSDVSTTQIYAKHRSQKLAETQRAMDLKLEKVGK